MTSVPVLLLGFNRPDRLAGLVDRLREVKPETVYVAVDGPRTGRADDEGLVEQTRAQAGRIDWPCDVRTLFRQENLGCGRGVSGAISWLFAEQERGIILEDDILPHPSFFPFCEQLLERYENDARVWAVSGCNFVPPQEIGTPGAYRFATVPHIWGWATWRRSWADYQLNLRGWRRRVPAGRLWQAAGRSPAGFAYWSAMFDLMARQGIDTWDIQAVVTAFGARGGLTATSSVNLVENVGFGAGATHTASRPDYLRPVEVLSLPIRHPATVMADRRSDQWTRQHVLGATPGGILSQAARFGRSRLSSRA